MTAVEESMQRRKMKRQRLRRILSSAEDTSNTATSASISALDATGMLTLGLMAKYVFLDAGDTFSTAKDFDEHDLQKVYYVIAAFGFVWVFGGLMMVYVNWRYQQVIGISRKKKAAKVMIATASDMLAQKASVNVQMQTVAGRKRRVGMLLNNDTDGSKDQTNATPNQDNTEMTAEMKALGLQRLVEYVTSVIPTAFRKNSILGHIVAELKEHHAYLRYFTGSFSREVYPVIGVLDMITIQSMLMFLLALLYDLQAPQNDGSCDNFSIAAACTERKSLLDPTQSYCTWNAETQSCSYETPKFSLQVGLYCAILVSLVTGFAMVPLDLLFRILYSPSEATVRAKLAAASLSSTVGPMRKGGRKAAVAVQPKSDLLLKVEEEYRNHGKTALVVKNIPEHTQDAYLKAKIFVHEALHGHAFDSQHKRGGHNIGAHTSPGLLGELSLQRQKLQLKELHVFDAAWGLEGLFEHDLMDDADHHSRLTAKLDLIGHEITVVEKESSFHIHRLAECSDEQKGVELLQLFVLDLLGRDSIAARILRAKMEEDFEDMVVVSKSAKVLAVVVVVCLNLFFAYYVMLRGVEQGVAWQRAFVVSVIVQWLVEALLFETIECLYVNCLLPSMASRDVQRVYETLNEAILHLAESLFVHSYNNTSASILNAPQYLFVSTTVSKAFPKLMESMLISAYRTYLPGHVASKWKGHEIQQENDRGDALSFNVWRLLVWVASVLSWIVQMVFAAIFAYTPLSIQKFILRVLQPFIATGVLYAWWYALTGYRSIVAIGSCLGLLFIYLLYQHRKFQNRRQNRLLSILPLVNALDEKEQEKRDIMIMADTEQTTNALNIEQRPRLKAELKSSSLELKNLMQVVESGVAGNDGENVECDDNDASSNSSIDSVHISVNSKPRNTSTTYSHNQKSESAEPSKCSETGNGNENDSGSDYSESDRVCSSSSASSSSSY
jgi:hypothetical protein